MLGDEGIGVRAVEYLQKEGLPEGVSLLDGGTGGFHLLELFRQHDPIIFIDATMDGAPPGTVRVFQPRFASDFPRTLSAHDIGLRDLLESAQLLAPLPRLFLVAISIGTVQAMQLELSPAVAAALPAVRREVQSIIETL